MLSGKATINAAPKLKAAPIHSTARITESTLLVMTTPNVWATAPGGSDGFGQGYVDLPGESAGCPSPRKVGVQIPAFAVPAGSNEAR